MKNSMYDFLIKASIPIFDKEWQLRSYGFILEFSIPNDNSKVIPFLIINYNDVKDLDFAVLNFNSKKEEHAEKYNLTFDKKFIENSRAGDFLVHPIASLFNDLNKNGHKLDYFGMRDNMAIDLDEPKTRSIENMSFVCYHKFNSEFIPTVEKAYNITPFYGENKDFCLIKHDIKSNNACGFPVFIADEGSFFDGKSLCIGNRIVFVGIAMSIVDDFVLVKYPKALVDSIKNKFPHMFNICNN